MLALFWSPPPREEKIRLFSLLTLVVFATSSSFQVVALGGGGPAIVSCLSFNLSSLVVVMANNQGYIHNI